RAGRLAGTAAAGGGAAAAAARPHRRPDHPRHRGDQGLRRDLRPDQGRAGDLDRDDLDVHVPARLPRVQDGLRERGVAHRPRPRHRAGISAGTLAARRGAGLAMQSFRKGATYGVLLLWTAVTIFPIYWTLLTSFKPRPEWISTPIRWIPEHPTLANY